ncbi:MAG: hypothetical protein LBS74_03580 [Oscillospiraceae bacterium]|jgi:sporulation integral membrane protein YlbJ|nr:hypothetical protein [Oscillospiraceae bacterium]
MLNKQRLKHILTGLGILLFCLAVVVYPKEVSLSVYQGLEVCTTILIPSLFPFIFLSLFIVKSGFAELMGRVFEPVFRRIFKLPGSACAAVFTALVGGYPSGAQAVAELYKEQQLSRSQAERMLQFCVCAGPAFLISTLGITYFKSERLGVLVLCAQIASALILGLISGFLAKDEPQLKPRARRAKRLSVAESFVTAARGTSSALLSICTFVVLFSVILCVLETSGIERLAAHLIMSLGAPEAAAHALMPNLLEVTNSLAEAVPAGLPFAAFITSFGGFCVHFQVYYFTASIGISKLRFTLFRLFHGLLSMALTALLLPFIMADTAAFVPLDSTVPLSMPNPAGSAALILLCAVTVLLVPDFEQREKGVEG